MKRFAMFALLLSLGLFSVGCDSKAKAPDKPATDVTAPTEGDKAADPAASTEPAATETIVEETVVEEAAPAADAPAADAPAADAPATEEKPAE